MNAQSLFCILHLQFVKVALSVADRAHEYPNITTLTWPNCMTDTPVTRLQQEYFAAAS